MSIISKQFGAIISKHGSRYMLVASGVNSNRLRAPTWRKISPQDSREQPTSLLKFGRKYNVFPDLGTQNMAVCDQLNCGQDLPGYQEIRIQTVLPMTSSDNPNTGMVTLGFDIMALGDVRSATVAGRIQPKAVHDNLLTVPPVISSDGTDGEDFVKTISFSIASLPEVTSRRRMRVSLARTPRGDQWILPPMQGIDPIVVQETTSLTDVSFDITTLDYA